jgi:hypothetical protein
VVDELDTIEPEARAQLYAFFLSLPPSTRVLVNGRETLPPAQARPPARLQLGCGADPERCSFRTIACRL